MKKLSIDPRKLKLPKVRVTFDKRKPESGMYWHPRRSGGSVRDHRCTVDLHREKFSIGTIIHEVGHHMDFIENGSSKGRRWHTNKLLSKIKKLARYCKKMDYWGWVGEKK